jgi:hypothetical protein
LNIIVMTIARSGSSMVTSILAAHGFNTSRGHYVELQDGSQYWTFESDEFKDYYRHNRPIKPGDLTNFHTFTNTKEFKRLVDSLQEPWVIKTGVEKYHLFDDMPAVVVKVRRSPEHIARSMAAKKGEEYDHVYPLIIGKQKLFDEVPGHSVYTEDIIAGDLSSLEPVFLELGVEFNLDKARECVDPDKWHYQ